MTLYYLAVRQEERISGDAISTEGNIGLLLVSWPADNHSLNSNVPLLGSNDYRPLKHSGLSNVYIRDMTLSNVYIREKS